MAKELEIHRGAELREDILPQEEGLKRLRSFLIEGAEFDILQPFYLDLLTKKRGEPESRRYVHTFIHQNHEAARLSFVITEEVLIAENKRILVVPSLEVVKEGSPKGRLDLYISSLDGVRRDPLPFSSKRLYPEWPKRKIQTIFKPSPEDLPSFEISLCDLSGEEFEDQDGAKWITDNFFKNKYEISSKTIQKRLVNIRTSHGIGVSGRLSALYNKHDALVELDAFIRLPSVDRKTRRYFDENGESWAALTFLSKKLGISPTAVEERLKDPRFIQGRDAAGSETRLYSEADVTNELKEFLALPKTDSESLTYVDEEGETWTTIKVLSKRFDVSVHAIGTRLQGARSIRGRVGRGHEGTLYNVSDVTARISEYLSLPKVSKQTGVYIDSDGQRWVPVGFLTIKYGRTHRSLYPHLKGIEALQGIDRSGREVVLYNEDEAIRELSGSHILPKVDQETRRYVNEAGDNWVTAGLLKERFNVSYHTIKTRLKDTRFVTGRAANNIETILYCESEAETVLSKFLSFPKVSDEGRYVDGEGISWVSPTFLQEKYVLSGNTVTSKIANARYIRGRGRNGKETPLFNELEASQTLSEFASLPQVDKETGKYIDEDGEVWVSADYLREKFSLGAIQEVRLKGTRSIKGRNKSGYKSKLYNEAEASRELGKFVALPRVDPQTLSYIDDNGERWVTSTVLGVGLGVGHNYVERYLGGAGTMRGRGVNGKEALLYHEVLAKETLNKLASLPQVDKETGKYIDEDGEVWVARTEILNQFGQAKSVKQWLKETSFIKGKTKGGKESKLFKVSELKAWLASATEAITPEEADEELRKLIEGTYE